MTAERIETTYADLRPTDLVIDKAGTAWPIDDMVTIPGDSVNFWLLDPVTKVRMHFMTRLAEQPVTVSRVPSHADEAAKLEAEFPASVGRLKTSPEEQAELQRQFPKDNWAPAGTINDSFLPDEAAKLEAEFPESVEDDFVTVDVSAQGEGVPIDFADSFATMEEAVAAVEEIGGTVEAEVTAVEVDAASAATEDAPVQLPPFADMTPLERRSHLYLLHGVIAYDMKSNDELERMHADAHRRHDDGSLKSAHIPHVHGVTS